MWPSEKARMQRSFRTRNCQVHCSSAVFYLISTDDTDISGKYQLLSLRDLATSPWCRLFIQYQSAQYLPRSFPSIFSFLFFFLSKIREKISKKSHNKCTIAWNIVNLFRLFLFSYQQRRPRWIVHDSWHEFSTHPRNISRASSGSTWRVSGAIYEPSRDLETRYPPPCQ